MIILGEEAIIIEYNKKENVELNDKYQTVDDKYLVKEKYLSAYYIFKGNYKLSGDLLTNKEENTLYRYLGEEKEYILPEHIKYINDYAFMRNAYLEKLTFHNLIEYQEEDSIYGCVKLIDITIPYLYEDPALTSLESDNNDKDVKVLSVFCENTFLKRVTLTKQILFDYPFFLSKLRIC